MTTYKHEKSKSLVASVLEKTTVNKDMRAEEIIFPRKETPNVIVQ